jgi:hypothetical protein
MRMGWLLVLGVAASGLGRIPGDVLILERHLQNRCVHLEDLVYGAGVSSKVVDRRTTDVPSGPRVECGSSLARKAEVIAERLVG